MNIFKKIWHAEPIIAGIVGNAVFWPTVVGVAAASGHPIPPQTQNVLAGLSTLLTAAAIRQTVTAPDTLAVQLSGLAALNKKVTE